MHREYIILVANTCGSGKTEKSLFYWEKTNDAHVDSVHVALVCALQAPHLRIACQAGGA